MTLIVILSSILLASCNESEDTVIVDLYFDVSFKNQDGEDLLNPSTTNSLTENDIKLYHLINNESVYYFKSNLDAPKGFKLLKATDNSTYYLRVFPDGQIENGESILYLEFRGTDLDTIKTYNTSTDSNKICTKIWYNENLVWDVATESGVRYFEILK